MNIEEATKKICDAVKINWNDFLDFCNIIRRPGIYFTDEQIKLIKKYIDNDNIVEAQKIILDQIEKRNNESISL